MMISVKFGSIWLNSFAAGGDALKCEIDVQLKLHCPPGYSCTVQVQANLLVFETRGSQEPVIAHLVFNLTSKVDRKWWCYT